MIRLLFPLVCIALFCFACLYMALWVLTQTDTNWAQKADNQLRTNYIDINPGSML